MLWSKREFFQAGGVHYIQDGNIRRGRGITMASSFTDDTVWMNQQTRDGERDDLARDSISSDHRDRSLSFAITVHDSHELTVGISIERTREGHV